MCPQVVASTMATPSDSDGFEAGGSDAPLRVHSPCSCRRLRLENGQSPRCERFDRWARRCIPNCDSADVEARQSSQYTALLARARKKEQVPCLGEQTMRQVLLDVERTCPALSFFREGGGREMLINILVVWIIFDADTAPADAKHEPNRGGHEEEPPRQAGYVQGMSFLAMNLLWHAGREETAFWVFVAMMQRYDMRCMFEAPDMHGLQKRTFATMQLLRYAMPALSDHLAEYLQNNLGLLLTDWLLTLFASSVALGPLGVLWDRFFDIGYPWIYRVILARLRCLQQWLLEETDFARLMHIVRFAHVDFDWVHGQLAPRLRCPQQGTSWVSSVGGGGSSFAGGVPSSARRKSGQKPGLLHRLVRGRRMSHDEEAPTALAEPEQDLAYNGQPAAWTCQICNNSEDCESWLTIVTELAEMEVVPIDVAERFEAMFSAPASAPIEPQQASAPSQALDATDDAADVRAENVRLRQENAQLRAELQEARKELDELRVARTVFEKSTGT